MKQKGYSLVELILSIAVFSVMMISIVTIMSNTLKAYGQASIDVDLQESAQVVTNQLEELLCDANSISGNETSGYLIDNQYRLVKSGKNLILYDNSGNELSRLATNVDSFKIENFNAEQTFNSGSGADVHHNYAYNQAVINLTLKNDKYRNSYTTRRNIYLRNNPEQGDFHSIDKMASDVPTMIVTDPDEKNLVIKRYETVIVSDMFCARYGGELQKFDGSNWSTSNGDGYFTLGKDTSGNLTKDGANIYWVTTGPNANKNFGDALGGAKYRFVGYGSATDATNGTNPIEVNLSIPAVFIKQDADNVFQWHSTEYPDGDHMVCTCIPVEGIDVYNGLNASSGGISIKASYTYGGVTSTEISLTGKTDGYMKKGYKNSYNTDNVNTISGGPINEGLAITPDPYTGGFGVCGGNPPRSSGDGTTITFNITIKDSDGGSHPYHISMMYDKMSTGF